MGTLAPYEGKLEEIRFAAYDLEWYPRSYKLRMIGLHDENGYYAFETMEAFLEHALTPEYSRTMFFAHAGGLADVQFVLEHVIRAAPDIQAAATFSGSSAVSVHLKKGKRQWSFHDSFWLLRDSLDRIGKSLGMGGKLAGYKCPGACAHPPDEKCVFHAPMPILRDYNRVDCEILYRAIEAFQAETLELGGSLRPTIAATAMRIFRAAHLRDTIPTGQVNDAARRAYVASRVEIFRYHAPAGAMVYDVNSSFPASMCKPQPGPIRTINREWGGDERDETALCLATVTLPEGYAPPLPYRAPDGGVYFPTGTWKAWLTGCDLSSVLEAGGRIEKVDRAIHFEPFHALASYVGDLYPRRETEHRHNCTPEQHSFKCLVYKYACNSLYGKFGQRPEKQKILIRPTTLPEGAVLLLPDVYSVDVYAPVPHAHVPIAAHVTAQSRRLLWRLLRQGEPAYYCDTDSVVTDKTLPTGTGLGELKLEHTLAVGADFLRPKLYRVDGKVKAKGFPRLKDADFDALVKGEKVHLTRMLRLRELYRSGTSGPVEHELDKGLRPKYRPKRVRVGDNDTRPWTVAELLKAGEVLGERDGVDNRG